MLHHASGHLIARYDLMEGDKLSDKAAPRIDATRLFKDAEARRAKLHKSAKTLTLEEAFVALEAQVFLSFLKSS